MDEKPALRPMVGLLALREKHHAATASGSGRVCASVSWSWRETDTRMSAGPTRCRRVAKGSFWQPVTSETREEATLCMDPR